MLQLVALKCSPNEPGKGAVSCTRAGVLKTHPKRLETQFNLPIWFSFVFVFISLRTLEGPGFSVKSSKVSEGISEGLLSSFSTSLSTYPSTRSFYTSCFSNYNPYIKIKSFEVLVTGDARFQVDLEKIQVNYQYNAKPKSATGICFQTFPEFLV